MSQSWNTFLIIILNKTRFSNITIMKATHLFLDDFRNPHDCMSYMPYRIGTHAAMYTQQEWSIVKNYDEFTKWITLNGLPEMVSFDHDLADEHYSPAMCGDAADYPTEFEEKTGLDCAKWLVDYCIDNKLDFPCFEVHSMNPVGSDRIRNYIQDYIKFSKQ